MLLPFHQAHDVDALLLRWQKLARSLRLPLVTLTNSAGIPVWALESPAARAGEPAIYLSAGVHGDEAAPPWALLLWAEQNAAIWSRGSFLILPCLNPVGLKLNTRLDHRGRDINRRFHLTRDPLSGPWRRWLATRRLRVGICLHEDYDAQGCYLYELGPQSQSLGPALLQSCSKAILPDPRRRIDTSLARNGVIRRKKLPTHLPGMPEAVELHRVGCPVTLTFETPSEFSLDDRVACQMAFIEAATQRIATSRSA